MEKISINILVREEEMEGKKVFIINNEDLGVSDFGNTLEQAISNFRKSVNLYLDVYPDKKSCLIRMEKEPLLVSKIFL